VPAPDEVEDYIDRALAGLAAGTMQPWAVIDARNGSVLGSTRYHDIAADVDRVEIGFTWYAARMHRTHLNPACKLLLLSHAFETLHCAVVGFRTDNFNFRSQAAIERLGAKRDGVIRHHQRRRDGTVRDSVMYSILGYEWPDVKRNLHFRLSAKPLE
jgi:RimJ/RimL family protein N-acetyltransferase